MKHLGRVITALQPIRRQIQEENEEFEAPLRLQIEGVGDDKTEMFGGSFCQMLNF